MNKEIPQTKTTTQRKIATSPTPSDHMYKETQQWEHSSGSEAKFEEPKHEQIRTWIKPKRTMPATIINLAENKEDVADFANSHSRTNK